MTADPLSVEAAYQQVWRSALTGSQVGTVGLELENHVVDLGSVARPVGWQRLDPLPDNVRAAAGRNAVTWEPGGQLELSSPPHDTVVAAVTTLRADLDSVRKALVEHGIGLAQLGTDPLRPSRRRNPNPRYRAMEEHFAAVRTAAPGAILMNSTASLQVNVEAGPEHGWVQRVAHAHRLGPALSAISASSPWVHSRPTGWRSTRQWAWFGLDLRRSGPVVQGSAAEPALAWARYALRAPVMFVGNGRPAAVCHDVTFEQWAAGEVRLGNRLPTADDLDLHLTTLWPPVRLRGYLELRYLDAAPRRWWPAIAAVAATLMDDPVAADLAAEATEPTGSLWTEAAHFGLADPRLFDSARRCLRIAADRAPAALSADIHDLAELVESRRSPGDVLAQRIAEVGPHEAFAELARP
ncbi:ergothioneine biosynthesis glutamate--cysteine ligase EgtA [Actinocrispum sp. NPDC049592]|uniref:ergothioneine biosynthesis glutamate--cysteine ligase EgtA n=1 Tax=Actinocrispum sp. NPDC049592 TaxID=3154835 RepID=UPI00343CBDB0